MVDKAKINPIASCYQFIQISLGWIHLNTNLCILYLMFKLNLCNLNFKVHNENRERYFLSTSIRVKCIYKKLIKFTKIIQYCSISVLKKYLQSMILNESNEQIIKKSWWIIYQYNIMNIRLKVNLLSLSQSINRSLLVILILIVLFIQG